MSKKFQLDSIKLVEFAVRLKDQSLYSIPIDAKLQKELKDVLVECVTALEFLVGDWEEYSVSEEYGGKKKLLTSLSHELMAPLAKLYNASGMPDHTGLLGIIKDVDAYLVTFWDQNNQKLVAVKGSVRFKGLVSERGFLARLTNATLTLIQDDVFRIDNDFDVIIGSDRVLIVNHKALERLANLKESIAAAAVSRVDVLATNLPFADFTEIRSRIAHHSRSARLAVEVARRTDLHLIKKDEIQAMAVLQGIKLKPTSDGKLRPRIQDHHKFLEILDDRRYISRITGVAVPFIARSRVKTT